MKWYFKIQSCLKISPLLYTSKPLISLSLLELVCALSGNGHQICPLQFPTSKPGQPRSVLCSAQHSFSRLGQGETAERQLLPSVLFGTWPMFDHAARYRRRQTHIWPNSDLDGERKSKLFLFYHCKSCFFLVFVNTLLVFTADGPCECEKYFGWLCLALLCGLFSLRLAWALMDAWENGPTPTKPQHQ